MLLHEPFDKSDNPQKCRQRTLETVENRNRKRAAWLTWRCRGVSASGAGACASGGERWRGRRRACRIGLKPIATDSTHVTSASARNGLTTRRAIPTLMLPVSLWRLHWLMRTNYLPLSSPKGLILWWFWKVALPCNHSFVSRMRFLLDTPIGIQ